MLLLMVLNECIGRCSCAFLWQHTNNSSEGSQNGQFGTGENGTVNAPIHQHRICCPNGCVTLASVHLRMCANSIADNTCAHMWRDKRTRINVCPSKASFAYFFHSVSVAPPVFNKQSFLSSGTDVHLWTDRWTEGRTGEVESIRAQYIFAYSRLLSVLASVAVANSLRTTCHTIIMKLSLWPGSFDLSVGLVHDFCSSWRANVKTSGTQTRVPPRVHSLPDRSFSSQYKIYWKTQRQVRKAGKFINEWFR